MATSTTPDPKPARRLLRVLGWMAAILAGALVLLFAVVGILHTFRGTPIARVHVSGGAPTRVEVADSGFQATVEALTSVRLTEGNRVEILLNEEVLRRLFADLRSARSTIAFRNYYALPGQVADSLAAVLQERARAGVQVLFLYDAFGSEFSPGYLERLDSAGVVVRGFRPLRWFTLSRAQNRSHVRAIVIDGVIGYTGGFGVADVWLGDGVKEGSWRETSVRFTGPAVRQLQSIFSIGWAEATGTLLVGSRYFPPLAQPAGETAAGVLYAVPTQGSTQAERFNVLSILGASRTLYITNSYFVPDDDQRRLLIDAARRGVDVRILTAGRHTDVPLVRLAGRAHWAELLRAGVRIYEYEPSMIHAKTLVADGRWVSVGTMNFDNRSAALNEESNLLVLDPGHGAEMEGIFLRDLRLAREIQLDPFLRRPWSQKLRERGAALLARLL